MKCLERNKTSFWYSPYIDKSEIIDEYGNGTGEYRIDRADPIKLRANISSAKGETESQLFGDTENYDRVIALDKVSLPIDEYTILWIDTVPLLTTSGELRRDADGQILTPHNYIVKKVAKSLNSTLVAISKVTVS